MADKKNYYDILGVSKTATADEIKSSYRKLVKQYHPDLHPNDEKAAEKFKEINEAHETLSDDKKRKEYDFSLEHPNMNFGGGGFSGDFSGFSDIFSDFFGGFGGGSRRTQRQTKIKGDDITIEVELSFLDAAKGCKRDVTYNRKTTCNSCRGTGAKNGTEYETCSKCGGTGEIQYTTRSGFFTQVSVKPCDECRGTGKKIKEVCPDYKGKGTVKNTTTVTFDIPAGADTGSYMRKAGYGEASPNGGPNGDLIVVFTVRPSKIFRRKQFDLYVDLPITYKTAVLGGKVEIPLIDGTYTHVIPEGTQSGKVFYVRGKGIKTSRGVGDLYIIVQVEVPTKLSKEQKKNLEKFDDNIDDKQYSKIREYADNFETAYGKKAY